MNELEEKLNALLNDPAELEKLSRMAAALMGGADAAPGAPDPAPDGELSGKLTGLLGKAGGNDKSELLRALAPYLQPERQARLSRALRLAKVARLAAAALAAEGGGRDV